MTAPITKAALKRAAQDMLASVEALPNIRTLRVGAETAMADCDLQHSRVDLHHLDYIREATKRRLAHELADELIRSGAIKLTEELISEQYRYRRVVRITGTLQVC
jgi:hypothetical protein